MTEEKVILDSPEFLIAHVMSFVLMLAVVFDDERRTREDEGK